MPLAFKNNGTGGRITTGNFDESNELCQEACKHLEEVCHFAKSNLNNKDAFNTKIDLVIARIVEFKRIKEAVPAALHLMISVDLPQKVNEPP